MGEVIPLGKMTYKRYVRELSEAVMDLTAITHQQEKLAQQARQVSLHCQHIIAQIGVVDDTPKAA